MYEHIYYLFDLHYTANCKLQIILENCSHRCEDLICFPQTERHPDRVNRQVSLFTSLFPSGPVRLISYLYRSMPPNLHVQRVTKAAGVLSGACVCVYVMCVHEFASPCCGSIVWCIVLSNPFKHYNNPKAHSHLFIVFWNEIHWLHLPQHVIEKYLLRLKWNITCSI